MTDAPHGPLAGLRVLDLTRFLSGPYCTLLLAGMGAEVIKVDDPASGDPTAAAPPFADADGPSFEPRRAGQLGLAYLKRARGKRSMTLNLKDDEGRALFLRLAGHADVVIENFRPGVAARLGIDAATLQARNPRLVYCALTGYGSDGPDRDLKAYDLMVQAASGLMGISGEPDGPPMKTATAFSDMLSGAYAGMAILAAIAERERSGRGQAVDVSMVECLFSMMMDEPLDCYPALGLPLRQGNRIMRFSPFNAYQARDGWLTIGVATAAEWAGLARAMDADWLIDDPDWSRVAWRITHNDEVDAKVSAWAAGFGVEALLARLGEHQVPCAPVRTPADVIAWPQMVERGVVAPLREPDGTPTAAVAADLPFRFDRTPAGHRRPAPEPGADTDAVLRDLLGLDAPAIAALRERGVV